MVHGLLGVVDEVIVSTPGCQVLDFLTLGWVVTI